MPEIAEVRTVSKVLNEKIVNKTIKDVNILYDKIIDQDINEFKNIIINKTIKGVSNFGKYLIFNLGEYSLISHLRMEGKYFIKKKSEPIIKHEHIIFDLGDITLRYHDTRKFGRMFVCKTTEIYERKELKKLGYEPNDKRLTVEYLKNKLNSNLPIKSILLDQTIINGLGNIYVDEVLYASKINPSKKGNDITYDEMERIIKEAKRITDKATELGGTTIRSYTSSLGVYGSYQDYLKVHTKKVCSTCNSKIEKIRIGGRGTYYCPKCQK